MQNVFLVCFLVGLGLTAVSFLLGTHGFGAHGVHAGHAGHGAHTSGGSGAHGGIHAGDGVHLPLHFGFLNTMTLTAFLTWFGGAGYLVTQYHILGATLAFALAAGCGIAGGAAVNYFLDHVLTRGETELRAEDYHLPGTAARVTSTIFAGHAGEITYALAGVTQTAAARSVSGGELPRNAEVVVLRYEGGVAWVETWDRALAEPQDLPPPALPSHST